MSLAQTKRTRAYSARPLPNIAQLPADALLTRETVSALSSFSTVTLRGWAAQGKGPRVTRVEGNPRYRVDDYIAWASGRAL